MPYINGQWVEKKPVSKVIHSVAKKETIMPDTLADNNNEPIPDKREELRSDFRKQSKRPDTRIEHILEIATRVQEKFGATGNFDAVFSEIMRVYYPYQ